MSGLPPWLEPARAEIGVGTLPPGRSNPRITQYHAGTNIAGYDDKAAWCSSFVHWCLARCGIAGTGSALARSWLDWGRALAAPRPGCIAVLMRDDPASWRGHVGFYVRDDGERVTLLGGNQQGRVCEHDYPLASLLGWRWPPPYVRRAAAGEAAALTALAHAAKASWGYAAADLERWRDGLAIDEALVATGTVWVADDLGRAAAVLACDERAAPWALEHLWVDPAAQRRGLGRLLLGHATARARSAGVGAIAIDADPHAEGFYRRCGAQRRGAVAAPIAGQPQRVRPQLLLATAAADDGVPLLQQARG